MFKNEQWKEIPGLTGYEASTCGRIRCWWSKKTYPVEVVIKEKVRIWKKPVPIPKPYVVQRVRYKGARPTVIRVWYHGRRTLRSIATLVLETFVGPREVAIHLDGNKYNNKPSNLKWGSRAEAQQIAIARGRSGRTLLDAQKAAEIRRRVAAGERTKDLATEFGVKPATISRIKSGQIWKDKPVNGDVK